MLKKFVVLLACLWVFELASCTSKDSKEDGGEEMAIDATATDSAEVEKVEGEQSLDIAAEDPSAASSLSTDALPEDALGESSTADQPSDSTPPVPEIAASEPPPLDTLPPDTALPPDALTGPTTDAAPPVTESVEPPQETASSPKASSEEPKAEPKPVAAYRKVEATPWKEGGKLLNTVYVARNGDSWKSVSQTIYGTEKASELKKMNPSIKGRKLKVGDKVYYNSPHRPDDSTKILTFYEDSGIAPEVYIAKSGDSLKKVAKELFGSEQGWKELYATNDFESKAALDEGTQIKYWRTVPTEPKEVAQAQPTMPPPPTSLPPPPPQMNEVPPPSAPIAEMPPPPPPPDMAANEMAPPPPPPPPPVEAVAPPPTPVQDMAKQAKGDAATSPLEDDQMTTLAAGAVVAVGLALFMIMRRRRKKELEQAIQDTQVG